MWYIWLLNAMRHRQRRPLLEGIHTYIVKITLFVLLNLNTCKCSIWNLINRLCKCSQSLSHKFILINIINMDFIFIIINFHLVSPSLTHFNNSLSCVSVSQSYNFFVNRDHLAYNILFIRTACVCKHCNFNNTTFLII
jgi:hypothetical protein